MEEDGWIKKKKSKYYNKKVFGSEGTDGVRVKSDSKLELYTKNLLDEYKIPYEYQCWYELFPSHVNWEGKTIKRMKMIVDFKIMTPCGITIWLDPKGCPTEEAKMKFKVLSFMESKKGIPYIIKWVETTFDAMNFIEEINDRYFKS